MISRNGQTLRAARASSSVDWDKLDKLHSKRRVQIAVLAAIGFSIASYLAAYQMGFLHQVWEPFFGDGSARVLHSFVSTLLPVPDALMGALGYAVEFVTTLAGAADRWHSHPKLVLTYGVIVVAIGVAGLILVVLQAFVLHAFCTLCLLSATISVVIAFLARGEVLASFKVLTKNGVHRDNRISKKDSGANIT